MIRIGRRKGRRRAGWRRGSKRRGRKTRGLRSRATLLSLLFCAASATALLACVSPPPRKADNLCDIFKEKRSWYKAALRSYDRWGVPESVQLAVIKQESSFRARARPKRSKVLWVLPGPRPSSAYGYGQVLDDTWEMYQKSTGRRGADRDDFADVTDFIGWYSHRVHMRTGVAKNDSYGLYLAYHEGTGGYLRASYATKPEVQAIARKVDRQAQRYQAQYSTCKEDLARPWYWPF